MGFKAEEFLYVNKVTLSGLGEEVVDRMVASGRCKSADQAVDISLRLVSKYEAHQEEKLKNLREDIAAGMDDVYEDRVAPLDMEAIIRESEEEYSSKNPKA